MKVTLAFSHMEENSIIKDYYVERAQKLKNHMKRFKDDLVYLHGALHKEEFYVSLSLYLPTVTLHCRDTGFDYESAMNGAFLGLIRQVEKHTDKLNTEKRRKVR
jgi:ribosome-associated translation inhibitor RaiA